MVNVLESTTFTMFSFGFGLTYHDKNLEEIVECEVCQKVEWQLIMGFCA
jgi:hypothetical protein